MIDTFRRNQLDRESSPYLLQHRHNPVHWLPWGREAFDQARAEHKPILLSIGYAACHWCHVMAHESFEDAETASLLNRDFISIKVDREERPDVDRIYMDALHAFGEQGGWPLTMFLDSEGTPFWGGTYFPDQPRFGRPSFRQILTEIARIWQLEHDKVAINTAHIKEGLELGFQWKALTLQGEHFWLDVERRASALSDPSFTGWYLQTAWTLTGQPRRYNAAAGGFDIPRVEKPFSLKTGDWGVWELAARYSDLDLNYRAGAVTPDTIRGGEQQIVSLGLNWYPNSVVRFLADYQHVEVDRLSPGGAAFGAGVLTPPAGAQVGQDLNIWSLRTQYAF